MESWEKVWRDGFAPQISLNGLLALATALAVDDPRLIQGKTMDPEPSHLDRYSAVKGACAIGFCGWQGDGLDAVGLLEDRFGKLCFDADVRLARATACRGFLNWFDYTPRDEMRAKLLPAVHREIERRTQSKAGVAGD